jgi:hypothetical protein
LLCDIGTRAGGIAISSCYNAAHRKPIGNNMSTPPFAPPYKSRIADGDGERWVAVAADGSASPTEAPLTRFDAPAPAQPVRARAGTSAARPGIVLLNVPYAEKDEAKQLGARWDAARRKWYVPAGVDPAAFSRWMAADA